MDKLKPEIIIPMNNKLIKLPREFDNGNREYKWKLIRKFPEKTEKFISQMKYRLYEGKGKALYLIGVRDDGTPIGIEKEEMDKSLDYIVNCVEKLGANIQKIRLYDGLSGFIATIRISMTMYDTIFYN